MSAASDSSPSSSSSVSPSRRQRLLRVGLGAVVAGAVWTVGLGWFLPDWVRPRIEAAATDALGVPVRVQGLAIQPWTLVVTLDGLTVGAEKARLLEVRQAQVRLSVESIWRWAPVIRRVNVTQPVLSIERLGTDRFNFTPVLQKLQSQPAANKADTGPSRFAVYNIRVEGGQIRYADKVLGQTHLIDALSVGIPFISSLPSYTEVDVQPALSARVDGSMLKLQGRTHPFSAGLRSSVEVHWSGVDLARWVAAAKPLLPASLGLDVSAGVLATDLTVSFEHRVPPAVSMLAITGRASVSDLQAKLDGVRLQTRLPSLRLDGIDLLPFEKQARIGAVRLEGLHLDMALPNGHALPRLGPVAVSLDGLDTRAAAAPAKLKIDLADEAGGKVGVSGGVRLAQQDGQIDVSLAGLQTAPWLKALGSEWPLPVEVTQGALGGQVHLQIDRRAIQAGTGRFVLSDFKARPTPRGGSDHVELASLVVDGVQADVGLTSDAQQGSGLRTLSLETVAVEQLNVHATRDARGAWLLAGREAHAAAAPISGREQQTGPMPTVSVKDIRCSGCMVAVLDQTVTPAARFSLQKTQLSVKGVSTDLTRPVGFELDTIGQGSGRIRLGGEVRPQPLLVKSQVNIAGLDLRAVQPYIDPYVNIELAAAKATAGGRLQLELGAGKASDLLQVRYQGRVGLSDVRTLDAVTQADFLRWHALTLDGLDVSLKGDQLTADLGRVALQDFYGRIIINPTGQLNLAEIVGREQGGAAKSLTTPQLPPGAAAPGPTPVAQAVPASAAAVPSAKSPMNLRWQGIKLTKGRVDFTDNYIKPNYSARLTRIEGTVSAVASTKPEPASVQIAGAVDDNAPLEITGLLHPLGPKLYTDIKGSAKGIELTRLTPYAARYAGYAIEKGSLSMTVQYKVDQGKLEAQNQIFLDQLTFGEKVDSPDATKLPVQLAVSLLKNSRGEIDINLPISGSLDDPEFSVGGIIWRVVVNLLSKAITAPFSLLFGGGHDEMGFVAFEPGAGRLSPAAKEQLDKLAAKLADRPALKLEATGRADPAVDVEGLRHRYVNGLMRKAKARELDKMPDDVTIAPEERERWLTAAYKAADIKKPRNLLGLAKSLPVAEMESLLEAAAPVDAQALLELANRRGDQVKAYLVTKLPPERVLLTASKVGTQGLPEGDKGSTSRVQFSVR